MGRQDEELLTVLAIVGIGYVLYTKGYLDKILKPGGGGGGTTPPPTTGGGTGGGSGGPIVGGELDENGVMIPFATTGNFVDMEVGGDPAGNGQRYNVNHKFTSYYSVGYYRTSSGQEAINHKTDGPNHGSCSSQPECLWAEPHLDLASGTVELQAEYPHPDNHNLQCASCKSVGNIPDGTYVGWGIAAYGPAGNRTVIVYVDPSGLGADGKPQNQWQEVMKEVYTDQLPAGWKEREIPINFDAGLEAEVRMHGDTQGHGGNGTDMQFARVYEIQVSDAATTAFARSFLGTRAFRGRLSKNWRRAYAPMIQASYGRRR